MTHRVEDPQVLPPQSNLPARRGAGRPANILRIAPDRSMPDRIRIIREYHARAITRMAQGGLYAILTGFELLVARAQVGHGDWERWVEDNCPFSYRSAHRYCQAAERKKADIPNLTHVADLLDAPPEQLTPAERDQLYEAVRSVVPDEVSARQLYLELGVIKEPACAGGAGGRLSLAEGEKLTRQRAWQFWLCKEGKAVALAHRRGTWKLLKRDELQGLLALAESMVSDIKLHLTQQG